MSESHAKRIRVQRQRIKRAHGRLRNRISGTPERPRLAFHKSSRYIYAQVIDDLNGRTLAQANSIETDLRTALEDASPSSVAAAKAVGEKVAERAREAGIESVVFDRGGYIYHGKVKALADAARSKGLKF